MSAGPQLSEPSVASLLQAAITDTQQLVRGQVELTKAELRETMKETANGAGLLIGAGVLGFLCFVFLLVAGAYGLVAAGLPEWAGFLIVAVVLATVAAILGLVGRKRLQNMTPPQKSMAAIESTKAALTNVKPSAAGTSLPATLGES